MIGDVIAERYEIVRVIGQGSHGAVCEVRDRASGEPAALKMLLGENPELAARLEREAKALATLAHPNVVALVDSGRKDDGSPYVVTELVRGVSLGAVIDGGALPPRRALDITRQVLEALDHAHGAGFIHRDIKPENIMLADAAGRDIVKLLDFGVAKMIDPKSEVLGAEKLTRAGLEVIGSPCYIAPEIAVGQPVDARADLYSLGIVLYEMLTGDVPFVHADTTTLLRMHITDAVPPLRLTSPDDTPPADVEAIVKHALAKAPEERYRSAMEMHAAIERVLAPPRARPSLPPAPRARWLARARQIVKDLTAAARTHPQRFAAIATAAVVLIIVGVLFASRSTGKPNESEGEDPSPSSIAGPPPTSGAQFVALAETEMTARRYGRAIAAYERALGAERSLASDAKLRTAAAKIATGSDAFAAVVALEVLATRLDPPDQTTIVDLASNGKLPDVRRRAFAIAERDGFAHSIDRLASWTLELKQQATCAERREAITNLRELGDPSAIASLQKARTQFACIAKDAAAAIAHLQTPK